MDPTYEKLEGSLDWTWPSSQYDGSQKSSANGADFAGGNKISDCERRYYRNNVEPLPQVCDSKLYQPAIINCK